VRSPGDFDGLDAPESWFLRKSPTGGYYENRGKEELGERRDYSSGLDFLVLLLGSAVLGNHCRGHRVAGGFGHGGQDSFRFPGARELDRLLLAGWEVSQFGQSLVSASG
jgi:hypothetical protein